MKRNGIEEKKSIKKIFFITFLIMGIAPAVFLGVYIISAGNNMIKLFEISSNNTVLFDNILDQYYAQLGTAMMKSFLIIISVAICFAFGLTSYFVQDVEKIIKYTQNVSENGFNSQIQTLYTYELSIIADAFTQMIKKIKRLINRTLYLEIAEKDSQFHALQAQISPHFLYNALDTINYSLLKHNDFQTSNVLSSITDLLRYSVSNFRSLVSIQDEIEQVENYLLIQKNRFEKQFDYSINIDKEIYHQQIPKLTFQPILENCFNHGIEGIKHKGIIEITGLQKGREIEISIRDNGRGLSYLKLKEINKKLINSINPIEYKKLEHEKLKNGYGIVNVNERIKIIFGEKYGVRVFSEVNKYTEVQITFLSTKLKKSYQKENEGEIIDEIFNC